MQNKKDIISKIEKLYEFHKHLKVSNPEELEIKLCIEALTATIDEIHAVSEECLTLEESKSEKKVEVAEETKKSKDYLQEGEYVVDVSTLED